MLSGFDCSGWADSKDNNAIVLAFFFLLGQDACNPLSLPRHMHNDSRIGSYSTRGVCVEAV